jgi:hypothetical protein
VSSTTSQASKHVPYPVGRRAGEDVLHARRTRHHPRRASQLREPHNIPHRGSRRTEESSAAPPDHTSSTHATPCREAEDITAHHHALFTVRHARSTLSNHQRPISGCHSRKSTPQRRRRRHCVVGSAEEVTAALSEAEQPPRHATSRPDPLPTLSRANGQRDDTAPVIWDSSAPPPIGRGEGGTPTAAIPVGHAGCAGDLL